MITYILVNGLESAINVDLITMCSDGTLGFTAGPTIGTATFIEVTYNPTVPTAQLPAGCRMVDAVVNNYPGGGDVIFIGGRATDIVGGVPLSDRGGAHVFVPGAAPNTTDTGLTYDVTNCGGAGYVVFDGAGNCIAMPRIVTLFHEMAHTQYLLSADPNVIEGLAIRDENIFRASIGLPPRADHRGSCFSIANQAGLCAANPNETTPSGAGTSTGGAGWIQCFMATAATGGPNSRQVRLLRGIRDNLLVRTRWGRRFFEEFYNYYYRFSPAIAEEMREDPNYRDAVGWALVTPLYNYYQLALMRPNWDLKNLPFSTRRYLESLDEEMDDWLAKVPLPQEFDSLSAEEAALELSVFLRFILRLPTARSDYLADLSQKGVLPLSGDRQELTLANRRLVEGEVPFEERYRIVGAAAARLRTS